MLYLFCLVRCLNDHRLVYRLSETFYDSDIIQEDQLCFLSKKKILWHFKTYECILHVYLSLI